MFTRYFSGRRSGKPRSSRLVSRRVVLGQQMLEDRWAMAQLTNGTGPGQLNVFVNEQGAFGSHGAFGGPTVIGPSPLNSITPNVVGDAFYNDFGDGRLVSTGTTYESGVAIGFVNATGDVTGSREFLTAGLLGTTGNNLSGIFVNSTSGSSTLTSQFFYPNTVTRNATNFQQIIGTPQLQFDLVQTLVPLFDDSVQKGTSLVQTYTVTNVSGAAISFDLVRYADFDIYHAASAVTPAVDGAGRRVVTPQGQIDGVFQIDASLNDYARDPSMIQVYTDSSGVEPLPRNDRWEVGVAPALTIVSTAAPDKSHLDAITHLRGRVVLASTMAATQAGNSLANDILPVAADTDANNVTDVGDGLDYAVALRNVFLDLQPNASVTYTVITQFGNPPFIGTGAGTTTGGGSRFEGHVTGFAFADFDGDNFVDDDDVALEGVVVYADLNNNLVRDGNEPFAVSNFFGYYDLCMKPGSNVSIRQEPKANFTPTTNVFVANVGLGAVLTRIDFGNRPAASSISGNVFSDLNRDGVLGNTEGGVAGFRVFVDYNLDGLQTAGEPFANSAADGSYTFADVHFGLQDVVIVSQTGYVHTAPASPQLTNTVNLAVGEAKTGVNFGVRAQDFTVSGVKYNDLNGNGMRESNEPGLPGFILFIDVNADNQISAGEPTAVSAADGSYTLIAPILYSAAGVPLTDYRVREAAPPSWLITTTLSALNLSGILPGASRTGVLVGNTSAFDFGDAPASFPSLLANNGARHAIHANYFLGSLLNAESNGNPSPAANAHADDDGVTLPVIITGGQTASLSVRASRNGFIQAWIDFNGDGNWNGPGEQVLVDAIPVAGQNTAFTIQAPTIINSGSRAMRVRYSPQRGLGYDGLALAGEVEDYMVNVGAGVQMVLPPEPLAAPGSGEGEDRQLLAFDLSNDGRFSNVDLFVMLADLRRGGAVDYWAELGNQNVRNIYDISGDGRLTNLDLVQLTARLRTLAVSLGGEGESLKAPLSSVEAGLTSRLSATEGVGRMLPADPIATPFAKRTISQETNDDRGSFVGSTYVAMAPNLTLAASTDLRSSDRMGEDTYPAVVADVPRDKATDDVLELISADVAAAWNDE